MGYASSRRLSCASGVQQAERCMISNTLNTVAESSHAREHVICLDVDQRAVAEAYSHCSLCLWRLGSRPAHGTDSNSYRTPDSNMVVTVLQSVGCCQGRHTTVQRFRQGVLTNSAPGVVRRHATNNAPPFSLLHACKDLRNVDSQLLGIFGKPR